MTAQTYSGGCQCGAVRYEVTADLDHTMTCNCSRCGRLGTVMAFVPTAEFKLLSGEDAMTEYLFNKHLIHHLFCATCGIQSFSRGAMPDGTAMIAINARCLDGVDIDTLPPPTKFDGRSM
jgi:hypothetical protein